MLASQLTGTVSGPYWANQLSGKLGYAVAAGEPYYTPGCAKFVAVRFSRRHHSATGMVRARAEAAPIYPDAEPAEQLLLDFGGG